MKYNWDISEEDKKRILNLHESATKRHYINESEENVDSFFLLPPSKEDIKYGQEICSTIVRKGIDYKTLKIPDRIKTLFETVNTHYINHTNPDDIIYGRIGKYFKKHTEIMVP
jgi:hypothetical protein